jgi:hypothetical protein
MVLGSRVLCGLAARALAFRETIIYVTASSSGSQRFASV